MTPVQPRATGVNPRRIKDGRGRFHAVNFPLIVVVAMLACYGLVVVHYATIDSADFSSTKQLFGVGLGIVAMALCWRFDYRVLARYVGPLLIIDILLLLSPHFPIIGYTSNGATSWIRIAGQQIQPGEIAKIVTIVLLASVISRYRGRIDSLQDYLKVCGILAIPFLCMMLQPDLGSGLVILAIGATIIFVGGANRKWLLITVFLAVAVIAAALVADPILDQRAGTDVFIKDYQMNRLLVFVDSSLESTDEGYQLKQSKIAIGSGGLYGKGLGNGTQSGSGFLPEAETDFIFATLGEELGFAGAASLLALYLLLFVVAFDVAARSSDLFGTLIVVGMIGMWAFQILENIGMNCGLMPITGIPLPFMSYGSSFMLANFMGVGLMLSVWRHRQISA